MKKLAFALAITLLLAACSSGSTVAPLDVSLNGVFTGTFVNVEDTQDGTATLNLSQLADSSAITGNAIFDTGDRNTCLINGLVTGTNSGASASLTIGGANLQLAISNNGNTLSGTYVLVTATDICSSESGSGTITLSRS
ncbi:MAG: hypothetical protein JKX81_18445 [Arenicella sp.]|nr:hypothetical protein [Arenicella sp.]